jgi:transmembrane sensor
MERIIPWNIVVKSFKGEANPEELGELNAWLDEDDTNIEVFYEIFQVYRLTFSIPSYFEPDKKRAWESINKQIDEDKAARFVSRFKYVAAILIIVLLSSAFFGFYTTRVNQLTQQYTEIVAPPGQKTMVVLPDGSTVWLNSGSILKYNGAFNVKDREVFLADGEAFFEVAKNKSKRFRVKTEHLFVDVYGTAFNVKNYKDDNIQEITVSEGKVAVADNKKELRLLTPCEQAVLDKRTNQLSFTGGDPDAVSSWKNSELQFDNTPLSEVVKYLERWYGVNIRIEPSSVMEKHHYTFTIKTESLTEMLEKMKVITPIAYEINGKEVKISYIH